MQDNSNNKKKGRRGDPYYQAQDILSRRDHSESEMRAKLSRKGFDSDDIEGVIDRLKQKKLIDDRQFADRFVTSQLNRKPVGPRLLSLKLKQKGVAQDIIQASIDGVFTDIAKELELIAMAADDWHRHHIAPVKGKEKLWRYLIGRGFTTSVISDYLEQLNLDSEDV